MARNHKPLVPAARPQLDNLKGRLQHVAHPAEAKFKAAAELKIPLRKGYNGALTAHDSGRIGGQLGGKMVQELIRLAQEQLVAKGER